MLIEEVPEWHLSARDEAEIAALLARCFDTDFGGRSYFIQRHHLRLIVRQQTIVGHMALLLRSVQLGERRLTVAGLADVATDPTLRGQGIASHLLQKAIAAAKASPAEYLLLFGQAGLYAAAGFQNAPNPLAHHVTKANRVARVTGKADHALMALPLRDTPWPDAALLDLLGPVF
jgi:predicted N-acetyltransferase YhbS